jgi:ankyrin repeat protein
MAEAAAVLEPALQTAARMGNLPEVERLVEEEGADIEQVGGQYATTALNEASWADQTDVVLFLLEHGALVTSKGINGMAPLHHAGARGNEVVAESLLAHGAEVSVRDDDDATPLHHAALDGRAAVTQLLLANGADMSAKDSDGEAPLAYACHGGHDLVAQLLLANGADMSSKNNSGWTPLHHAAKDGHEGAVRVLLEHGAEISSEEGWTPQQCAAQHGHIQIVAMLQAEALRREALGEAFAMALHERLGAGSWVQGLEEGLVKMVLEQV